MSQGDATGGADETAEELLPEDVSAAPQGTHRRPKPPEQIRMAEIPLSVELDPALMERPPNSAPASDPYLGRLVADRYHVERILGVGSMGIVYLCRHTVLESTVALKIIRPDLAKDLESVGRFVTEAKAASAIGSKHIVQVHDFGNLPDGATYIVMEHLEGITLGEALDKPSGVTVDQALQIGIQIAEALSVAHAAGVVHRDLKPDNIFLLETDNGWFVKILDFGIAKILSASQKLTQAGSVMGTPHYMAPEQATGGRTDERTDIYSLGVMLYEMVCGQVPFDAENPLAVISMQVTDPPVPLRKRMQANRTLPQGLESVVHKCLEKDPVERFHSMSDVQAALERIALGGVPLIAPPSRANNSAEESATEELADTDFKALRAGARRKRWFGRLLVLAGLGGAGYAAATYAPRYLHWGAAKDPAKVSAPAPLAPPLPSASAPAVELTKVALILFPLDAHAYEGKTDLGMMPITIELKPGEEKIIDVVRRGYVSRRLKVDGEKTRLVVGLVSDASSKRDDANAAAAAAASARLKTTRKTGATSKPKGTLAPNPFDG
jgi:serine/threonine-protein kinase